MKKETREMLRTGKMYFACYVNAKDMANTAKAQEYRELSKGYFDAACAMASDADKAEVLFVRKKLNI